jgi:hypothetical protein
LGGREKRIKSLRTVWAKYIARQYLKNKETTKQSKKHTEFQSQLLNY